MTFKIINSFLMIIILMLFQNILPADETFNLGEYKRRFFFTPLYFATLDIDTTVLKRITTEKIVDPQEKISVNLSIENLYPDPSDTQEKKAMAESLREAFGHPINETNIISNKCEIKDETVFTADTLDDIRNYIDFMNKTRKNREVGDKTVLKTYSEGKGKILYIPKDECSPNDMQEHLFKTDIIHKIIYTFIKEGATPEGIDKGLTANMGKFNDEAENRKKALALKLKEFNDLSNNKLASSFSPDNL